MAQGRQETPNANELWASAAARCGYAVHNGQPLIGVSGDEGDGFLVPLSAPEWFAHITSEGAQDNAFRAMAAHALRVGQSKVKAADTPTREIAVEGANSALNGAYKPGRERSTDILDAEASKQFALHVRARVLAVKADATEDQIAATVASQADTDAGKKWIADRKAAIAEAGTYAVERKGKGGKPAALAITLD